MPICLQPNRAGAKLFWCHIVLMPNCSGAIFYGSKLSGCQIVLVPNCSGAKLSWCQIIWGQIVMVSKWLVTNCPGAKFSWCQIFLVTNCLMLYCHGAKLTWCQIVQYQIVLLPKCMMPKCMVPNCMVPNFPGTVCDLQGKFSVHIFFTQLIFCIFFLLMQISNILAVQTFLLFAVCICKKFHTILKSHNVLTCVNTLNFSEWDFLYIFFNDLHDSEVWLYDTLFIPPILESMLPET